MNDIQRNFKKQIQEIEREKRKRSQTIKLTNGDRITYYYDKDGRVINKEITTSKELFFKPKTRIDGRILARIIILIIAIIVCIIVFKTSNGHQFFFFI